MQLKRIPIHMALIGIIAGLIPLLLCTWAGTASPEAGCQVTILAAGNSLTAGLGVATSEAYPALLEQRLRKQGKPYCVINAGISGETSSGLKSRIHWLLSLNPDIIIIETGANDGMRGIELSLVRENIQYVIRATKQKNTLPILAGMQMFPNMGVEYTRSFSQIYAEIAEEEKIVFMPFFLADVAGKPELNLPDGIHPNARGYRLIVDNVYPYVMEAIRQRADRK